MKMLFFFAILVVCSLVCFFVCVDGGILIKSNWHMLRLERLTQVILNHRVKLNETQLFGPMLKSLNFESFVQCLMSESYVNPSYSLFLFQICCVDFYLEICGGDEPRDQAIT